MQSSWKSKMLKWLYNKFINEHTPQCMTCGWNMRFDKESMFRYEWRCIWESCGWGTFQTANGVYHWWKKKN